MKIGFFTPQISENLGGIQNTSYLMAGEFSKENEFTVFCANDSEELHGNKLTIIKSSRNQNQTIGLHLDNIVSSIRQNRNRRFDFSFASIYTYGVPCLFLKIINKVPYGIMVHGNELLDRKKFKGNTDIRQYIKNKIRLLILSNADVIFANSYYTKQLCDSVLMHKNVVVIHPPVSFKIRHQSDDNHKKWILLSVGRLVERKGFQHVIIAMSSLVKKYPKLKYYIAGSGPFEKDLIDLIDKFNLKENVILCGRVSETEKDRLYQECDYFIMPSFTIEHDCTVEGFGIVYIEANMYGKYVIATEEGGIPDAINRGVSGDFVQAKNPDSIVEMIDKLYSSEFTYDKQKCVDWAKTFGIERIVKQYLLEISKVIYSTED